MGASFPTKSNIIVEVCREKGTIKSCLRGDLDYPLQGLRDFLLSHQSIRALASHGMNRPPRQSDYDFAAIVDNKIAARFASAASYLAVVTGSELTEDGTSRILALIRLESSRASNLVHLSLLLNESRGMVAHAAGKLLLSHTCGDLRRTHRKKRVRAEVAEKVLSVFDGCGFLQMSTQESLRVHSLGDPRRVVLCERRLGRWDDMRHMLMIVELLREGRAQAVSTEVSFHCVGTIQKKPRSAHGSTNTSTNTISKFSALQWVMVTAATQPKGGFWEMFFQGAVLWVHF